MQLRPYQLEAVAGTIDALNESRSALGVAATGLGKTVIIGEVIRLRPRGRIPYDHLADRRVSARRLVIFSLAQPPSRVPRQRANATASSLGRPKKLPREASLSPPMEGVATIW